MTVPTTIATIVIAQESGNRDPVEHLYRTASPVFDIPVSRAVGATSPNGLYAEGPAPCEFLLYCDGSIGCFPCAERTAALPKPLETPEHWAQALAAFGIAAPQSVGEVQDFEEWLAAMLDETEAAYADNVRTLFSEET